MNATKKEEALERIASSLERIARALEQKGLGPKCPKCDGFMIEKQNKAKGTWFLGCTNWPKCKYTRPLREQPQESRSETTPFSGAPGPGYSDAPEDEYPFG